jgi:hypothetical protein
LNTCKAREDGDDSTDGAVVIFFIAKEKIK